MGMTDHAAIPDYELADTLALNEPAQYAALFEDTRTEIVRLLSERAATTSELAEALGKPKGTIGHHLKVLADAGLVHVVRTERVRALEARYYGRTARVFYYHPTQEVSSAARRIVARAAAEFAAPGPAEGAERFANIRYARVPAEQAADYFHRLELLLGEFATEPREGDVTFGLLAALFDTDRTPLAEPSAAAPAREDG